jgi:hypothetical protein
MMSKQKAFLHSKMNHGEIHTHIDSSKYDAIVSIGNKCPTAMILRELGIYRESFPFDYVPTTPKLILKYLKDPFLFYPAKGELVTADGVWFGHYDICQDYYNTVEMFKRRFDRLFSLLSSKKKILFVYTAEADIYNELGNRYADNYQDLKDICKYIEEFYKYTDFTLVAIHTNKYLESDDMIVNYTISVDDQFLSNNKETNIPEVFLLYRDVLKSLLIKIFLG